VSLNLYMDHNVHAAITEGLRQRDVDCLTARDDGASAAEDQFILARARELGRIVFTQDADFLEITASWLAENKPFAGVIYARQMGITIGQAILDLHLFATLLEPHEMENRLEYIPL
jgi:predicted nuclease of predicted toxin-antitoxin system